MLGTLTYRNLAVVVLISMMVSAFVVLARPTIAQIAGLEPAATAEVIEVHEQRSVPTLTAEQRAQIIGIAQADQRLAALLPAGSPDLGSASIVVWTDNAGNLLGGVATVALEEATLHTGEWLGLNWEGASAERAKPYSPVPYTATFENLDAINVFVDLQDGTVAGISPGRGARMVGESIPPSPRSRPSGD